MTGALMRFVVLPFVVGALVMGGIWFGVTQSDDGEAAVEYLTASVRVVGLMAEGDDALAEGDSCSFASEPFGAMIVRTDDYQNLVQIEPPHGRVDRQYDGRWRCVATMDLSLKQAPFYVFDVEQEGLRWIVSAEDLTAIGYTMTWPGRSSGVATPQA